MKESEVTKQLIKTVKTFDKMVQDATKSLKALNQTLAKLSSALKGDSDAE